MFTPWNAGAGRQLQEHVAASSVHGDSYERLTWSMLTPLAPPPADSCVRMRPSGSAMTLQSKTS